MQNAMKTTAEAGLGTGSAFIAGGALSPDKCNIPTFSEIPLFFIDQYAFTIDDGFRALASIATVITIVYFLNKFRSS
jgi:hypothetical protein